MNMSKKYYIEIYYETGDSFGSQDEIQNLEIEWNDIKIAKENLRRIKEHYEWYLRLKGCKTQKEYKEIKNNRPEFVSKKYDFCITLITDDHKEIQMSCFWCGYFETLYSAKIKIKENEDMDLIYTTKHDKYR